MTKTLVVQIGNTDNKLTQQEWAYFILHLTTLTGQAGSIHFAGGSSAESQWQNYCIVVELDSDYKVDWLKSIITDLRKQYKQDSAAIVVGEVEFI